MTISKSQFLTVLPSVTFPTVGELPADETRPAADVPQPHSHEESLTMFRVELGFRVELVAAESHLASAEKRPAQAI